MMEIGGACATIDLLFLYTERTGGSMKKLEEMNLLDDFLVNSLMSHKEYGEAASKIILGRITRRVPEHLTVVPQKVYVGEDPKYHGVR